MRDTTTPTTTTSSSSDRPRPIGRVPLSVDGEEANTIEHVQRFLEELTQRGRPGSWEMSGGGVLGAELVRIDLDAADQPGDEVDAGVRRRRVALCMLPV